MNIAVNVLGISDGVFHITPDLLTESATRMGGEPVFSSSPFAAPCTDGLLIVFTMSKISKDAENIHGAYVFIDKAMLEKTDNIAFVLWQRADKPIDSATTLLKMGYGETRPWRLN